jgi:uncharacterized protein YqjF (DUF2071 family)
VEGARLTYRLPYRRSRFAVRDAFDVWTPARGRFHARYRPVGEPAPARPGTLEHFLVERYCLYGDDGRVRADIHHAPWPLQQAEAQVTQERIAPVPLAGDPICHYAERQDVVVWRPVRL